jgi:hypothetical protein
VSDCRREIDLSELAVNPPQDLDRGLPVRLVARAEVDAKETRRGELELLPLATAKIDGDSSGRC